jgi:hypothetical protein
LFSQENAGNEKKVNETGSSFKFSATAILGTESLKSA